MQSVKEKKKEGRRRAKVNKIKIYLSKVFKMSRNNLVWKTSPQDGDQG